MFVEVRKELTESEKLEKKFKKFLEDDRCNIMIEQVQRWSFLFKISFSITCILYVYIYFCCPNLYFFVYFLASQLDSVVYYLYIHVYNTIKLNISRKKVF